MSHADEGGQTTRPRKRAIVGMGALFFVILAIASLLLCNFRIEYVTQNILNRQRDSQQLWLDKSLESIRVWRNELLEQARYISAAELFRLFVIDARGFSPAEIATLSDPDTLHSKDDFMRSMAEQYTYIQDLLRDFTNRRAWSEARILLPDGTPLVEPKFSARLLPGQTDVASRAASAGQPIFGPVRNGPKGLVMDVADPLYEMPGAREATPIAVLLLSVPMERPLATFLARRGDQSETLLPRIVNKNGDGYEEILATGGAIRIEPVKTAMTSLENLPFGERLALNGASQVYSLASSLSRPPWLYVMETPAREVQALIKSQKAQIYGLGILASVGIALLAAFIWAALTSRAHEARARRLQELYDTINEQNMMLDSMNASLDSGILLSDQFDRAEVCNPAFARMCGRQDKIPPRTPLAQLLPPKVCPKLLAKLNEVRLNGQFRFEELWIPEKDAAGAEKDRLYRVNIYPYVDAHGKSSAEGTVSIFEDITDYRRQAQIRQEREKALISAMGRAIESVDPNLVGHSDKMENVAALLAKQLGLTPRESETLRLSARLSQIGKIFVPREILTKEGRLTPEELAEARRAPEYADKILHDLHFDLPIRETVRLIGERMNGSGRPAGLAGGQISREGRALAIINAFIAMTSGRSWRGESMDIESAIAMLKNDPGFDQEIVTALAALPVGELEKALRMNTRQDNAK